CCTVPFDEEEQVEEPRPEAAEAGAPAEEPRAAAPKPQAEAKAKEEEMKISPAAKKLMEEQGVGVGPGLTGSGPGGRIVKEDVERFLQQRAGEKKPSTPAPSEKPAPEASEEAAVEVSRMRAAIAKRMTQSKQTIPHFYVTREVDMGEAVRLVDSLNRLVPEDRGVSYNDIIIKACAVGLKDHPELNAHITDKGLIQKSEINIGVVVALKVGLLVPVVHNADTLPVTEISARVKGMRQRVLKRESTQEDLSGGTFTVSNMGMFGVEEFSAIINPPQVAILAVAAVKDVPVVKEGNIVPGKMMKLTLSADHRAVDGVMVARYLQRVKELLEDPVVLVVQ
ncbi:MAG TPA: dihydrolipoamide acetyltransferase family protein, partial [Thermodesulfobacteriota bacterium]|nr:dihydrolipoamide acetyltransferase family protein [Thermodesulfobacteriota bacterium]